jgi:hypothetical protein
MTSTRKAGQVALMKEERVSQVARSRTYEGSMFEEEFRRARRYDEEVCPPKHQSMLQYVVSDGADISDVLVGFGKRTLPRGVSEKDITAIIEAHNFVETRRRICKDIQPLKHDLGGRYLHNDAITKCIKSSDVKKLKKDGKSGDFFVLPEVRDGFSLVFGEVFRYLEVQTPLLENKYELDGEYENGYWASVFGLPMVRMTHSYGHGRGDGADVNDVLRVPKNKNVAFKLGSLHVKEGLADIAKRRFNYIFGCSPVSEEQVIDSLVSLNKLEDHGSWDGELQNPRYYKLVDRRLDSLKAPRAAHLVFDEAVQAIGSGLFKAVKVYELVGRKKPLPKKDPVIVGIDQFGQWYPVIYWGND